MVSQVSGSRVAQKGSIQVANMGLRVDIKNGGHDALVEVSAKTASKTPAEHIKVIN